MEKAKRLIFALMVLLSLITAFLYLKDYFEKHRPLLSAEDFHKLVGTASPREIERVLTRQPDLINTKTWNMTALHYAAAAGNRKTIETLFNEDPIDIPPGKESWTGQSPAGDDRYPRIVELLLAKGADVNARTSRKCTALHYAAAGAREKIVELLIAEGAAVNTKDTTRQMPLHYAVSAGHKNVVEFLIAKGAHIDPRGGPGDWTPLHYAAGRGDNDLVELLVAKGADLSARASHSLSGSTPLQYAALMGHLATVQVLIPKGADVNTRTDGGRSALQSAAGRGHKDVAEFLIAKGADVNAKNKAGTAALDHAAREGHTDVVALLIAKGADVNATDNSGLTALHRAVREGHKETVELLLTAGADVNHGGYKGWTPLHYAAYNGHIQIARLLLAKGANVDAKRQDGQIPLDVALEQGRQETADLLHSHAATAASNPPPQGFEPLFNGTDLTGWKRHDNLPGHALAGKWIVADGAIVGAQDPPGQGGFLTTLREFRYFDLRLETKIDWPFDSGVFLRVGPDGKSHQVTLDYRPGGEIGGIYCPWTQNFVHHCPEGIDHFKKQQWNSLRILFRGQPAHIRVWLNDTLITDFQHTPDTTAGIPEQGTICLQVHPGGQGHETSKARFRNIFIKELPP